MANVIEIVIRATDQATAQIRAAEVAASGLGSRLAGLSGIVGPGGVAAAFGAAAVAAGSLTMRFSDEIEMLDNLSRRTGVALNDLRALRQVMVEAGLSPEALTTALTLLNRNLADGNKELVALVGSTRDPMQALLRLSEVVRNGGNAASVAFAAMGRGGAELAPVLAEIANNLGDVRDRMGEVDEATLQAARHFDQTIDQMKTRVKALGDEIAGFILKTIEGFRKAPWLLAFLGLAPGAVVESALRLGSVADLGPTGASGPNVFPEPRPAGPPGKPLKRGTVELGDVDPDETRRQAEEAMQRFRNANAEALTLVEGLAYGIEGSITTLFTSLTSGLENFGSALKKLFDGIAQSILAALAKIATSKLLIWVAGLIGGPFGSVLGEIGGQMVGRTGGFATGGSLGRARGDTYNINALDARSLTEQLRSPASQWNRAVNRAAIGTSI